MVMVGLQGQKSQNGQKHDYIVKKLNPSSISISTNFFYQQPPIHDNPTGRLQWVTWNQWHCSWNGFVLKIPWNVHASGNSLLDETRTWKFFSLPTRQRFPKNCQASEPYLGLFGISGDVFSPPRPSLGSPPKTKAMDPFSHTSCY